MQRGISTIEIMIAMAVMVLALSAVVIVSFGNQNMLIGSETNAEAMNKAQNLLEQAQQYARKDFRLVNATSSTDDIYTKTVSVEEWPNDPYGSKLVTAKISWMDQRLQERSVALKTVLSNFMNAVGGDTCASPTGNWAAPQSTNYALSTISGVPTGTYTIGNLDAYRGYLYVAASTATVNPAPTLLVFDITNLSTAPQYRGSIDNNTSSQVGLNAVVAGNTAIVSGVPKTFAYGVNGYGANFNTCSQAANCSQLQVFDVTNPTNPTVAYSFKFATSTYSSPNWQPYISGSGGQAVGKSIFYKDGYVYIGLSNATGPEFAIIDVHNPLNPAPISSYEVGAGVENIYVRGKYAYLATDDNSTKELIVLDISNPLVPTAVTGVYNPPGMGYGRELYAVGDTLYFGKTNSSPSPEFYALDVSQPGSGVTLKGSRVIGASITGLIIRHNLAFALTSTSQHLNILDISNPSSISDYASPLSMPGQGVALDCERNYLYAGSNSGASGYVSVIKPSP